MGKYPFRREAHDAAARAEAWLDVEKLDQAALRYAALDLRLAMEALTYERAGTYERELPSEAYDTWQPRKLMQVLLDIDPSADAGGTLSVGLQEGIGSPATQFEELGTERVFNLANLKRHYDALGSYLHLPTLKQIAESGGLNFASLERRLREIAAYVDSVLSSSVFNVNFGVFTEFACSRCEAKVRWRMPRGDQGAPVRAICRECSASFHLEPGEGQSVVVQALQMPIPCPQLGCGEQSFLWEEDAQEGRHWTCAACGGRNEFVLAVRAMPAP